MSTVQYNNVQNSNEEETKQEPVIKAEKVLKSAEQLLETLRALDAEIAVSIKQTKESFDGVEFRVKSGLDKIESLSQKVSQSPVALSREVAVLSTVPDRLTSHLTKLAPQIASKVYLENEEILKKNFELIKSLDCRIKIIIKEIDSINKNKIRTKIKSGIVLIFLSVLFSAGVTYGMSKFFPQKVFIDTKGNILVDNSRVSLFGTGKNTIVSK